MIIKFYLKTFLLFFALSLGYILSVKAVGVNGLLENPVKQRDTTLKTSGITYSPPTISYFTPTKAGKGMAVDIHGTNFLSTLSLSFGGVAAASFTIKSDTEIIAYVGTGASGDLKIFSLGGSTTSSGFVYYATPVITSFTPQAAGEGATVTITGTNFTDATKVTFGNDSPMAFKVVTPTTITATITSAVKSGSVSVTTPGGVNSLQGFVYVSKPVIKASGATTFTANKSVTLSVAKVTGYTYQWLKDGIAVAGKTDTAYTVNQSGSYTATYKAGTAVVTSNPVVVTVTPAPKPEIYSFTPTTVNAGATVNIAGTGFTGATALSFGGVAAKFSVLSDTTITATVGKGASGSVVVTIPTGVLTAPQNITYTTQPYISAFSPGLSGPGKQITLDGFNFTGATGVSFGGVPAASFTVSSDIKILATVGKGATGVITVNGPNGSGSSTSNFVYFSVPAIASFTPSHGKGGDTIIIKGSGLQGLSAVKFGGIQGKAFAALSDSVAYAIVNTGATGQLTVTTPGGTATSQNSFHFDTPAQIKSFVPTTSGPLQSVLISGTNFTEVTGVKFGNVAASSFTVTSPTSITAYVGAAGGSGQVSVTTASGTTVIDGFTFVPNPKLIVSGPTTFAPGDSVILTASTGSQYTYLWFKDKELLGNQVTYRYIAKQGGNYSARVRSGGYTAPSDTVAVIVYPDKPVLKVLGITNLFAGDSVTLSTVAGNGYAYAWYKDNVLITNQKASSWFAKEAGTYTVNILVGNRTFTTNTVTLTVIPFPPHPKLTASGPTTFVPGGSVVLSTPTLENYTFTWYKNKVLIPNQTSNSYTATQSGIYYAIVKLGNNIANTDSITVNVTASVKIPITASGPTTFIAGDSVILSTLAFPNYTFAWYKNKVLIPNQTNPYYTVKESGAYKVVGNNMDSSDSIIVNVLPPVKPTLTASGPTTFVNGSNVTFKVIAPAAGYTYTWYRNRVLIPSQDASSYTATQGGDYKAMIKLGSYTAYTDSVTVTILVPPKPGLTASGPTAFNLGDSVTLSVVPGVGYSDYTWYKDRVLIPNQTTPSFTAKESGLYMAQLRIGSIFRFSDSIMVNALLPDKAPITASGPTTVAAGDSVVLNVKPGPANSTYTWYKNGQIIPAQTTSRYVATQTGSYTVYIQTGSTTTAADPVTVTVQQAPAKPVITASGPTTFTQGDNVILRVTEIAGYNGYSWYKNGVLIPNQTTAAYNVTESGLYLAQVKIGTASFNTDSIMVTVLPAAKPVITASGPTTFTQGDNVTFRVTPGAGYNGYSWYKNRVLIPNQTGSSYTATESGLYMTQVKIGTIFLNTDSISVNVLPPAKPLITPSGPTTFATGDSVIFNVKPNTAYTAYAWYKNGTLIPNQNTTRYVAAESGYYSVIGKAGSYNVASDSVIVTVYFALPVTNFKTSSANVTCKGQHNGSVNIKATKLLNYTATVTGDVLKAQTYTFTDHLDITGLAPAVYNVCITVQGHPEYQQCYNLIITEPKDLAVYSAINQSGNSVNLQLNGGDTYRIQLNDKVYTTTDHTINLPLNTGSNKLSVTTDKLCQGEISQVINNTNNLKPYPNPFTSLLYVNLGQDVNPLATVKIYRLTDGGLVLQQQYVNRAGVVQLDVSALDMGVYSFHLLLNNSESVFKINKQ